MYDIFEQLLQKNNVTAYKAAKETGVTQTALSNWKSGKSTPATKTLQKLADYFGVTIDYLLTGNENEEGRAGAKSGKADCGLAEDRKIKSENRNIHNEAMPIDERLRKIMDCYNAMDNIGKEGLVDYAEHLLTKHQISGKKEALKSVGI